MGEAIAVHSSELNHIEGDAVDPEVLLADRIAKGTERLEAAREALAALCEPVAPSGEELDYIRFFCGNTEISEDIDERLKGEIDHYLKMRQAIRLAAEETIDLGGMEAEVVLKEIKNIHLSVYPPDGAVRISAPKRMKLEAIRAFALSRLGWIRGEQRKLRGQEREFPREYRERESHYVWGRRYLFQLEERDGRRRRKWS